LGLTLVTFETMFTGLERQLSNITASLTRQTNEAQRLEQHLESLEKQKNEIKSAGGDTIQRQINKRLVDLQTARASSLKEVQEERRLALSALKERLDKARDDEDVLSSRTKGSSSSQIKSLNNSRKTVEKQIVQLETAYNNDTKRLQNSIDATLDQRRQRTINARKDLESDKIRILQSSSSLQLELKELTKNHKVKIETINDELKEGREIIRTEYERMFSNPEKCHIFNNNCGKEKKERAARYDTLESENKNAIRIEGQIYSDQKRDIENQIETNKNDLLSIQSELKQLSIPQTVITENDILDRRRKSFENQLKSKVNELEQIDKKIQKVNEDLSGTTKERAKQLQAKIKRIESNENVIKSDFSARIDETNERFATQINQVEQKLNEEAQRLSDKKAKLPAIDQDIEQTVQELEEVLQIKREKSQASQIYRMAAWYFSVPDISKVAKYQLDFVSGWWFGSIAFLVSIMGTVLALTSYILSDPEAFKDRQEAKFFQKLGRVLRLFVIKFAQLVMAFIKLSNHLIILILSLSKVFNGLFGRPLQRSFRAWSIARRKRMNTPKVVIREKEVEKEVIVEVVKEVPVEKVVMHEVPKEIIRKELVYVTLYSNESDLLTPTKKTSKDGGG